MEDAPRKKNYFNLILGIAFLGYGVYRLFTFANGAPYSTFRIIIAIGFVLLGAWDLQKFYKSARKE